MSDRPTHLPVLGAYRLIALLGTGGMAEVYEAEHVGLKKRVAVKVLKKELAVSSEMRARFLREGVAASRIRHPHVVDVTDVGEIDGTAYLVMELLEGESLATLLRRSGRLATDRALDLILPVIAALADAHRAGVIHRDVKPENVFLARTPQGALVPKLLDFGVSRIRGRSLGALTAEEEVLGTPHYMSPEQARGEDRVDAAADQYAMGVLVYRAMTSAYPHGIEGPLAAVLTAVAHGTVIAPSVPLPDIDPALEQVLLRALSARADRRYPGMESFGKALAPFATERGRMTFAALVGVDPSELSRRPTSAQGREITKPTILPQRGPDQNTTPLRGVAAPPPPRQETTAPFVPRHRLSTPMVPEPMAPNPPANRDGLVTALALGGMLIVMLGIGLALEPREPAGPSLHPRSALRDVPSPRPPIVHELVSIHATPESAIIEIDGVVVGIGHYEGDAPRDGVSQLVTVHAPGFVRRQLTLTGPSEHEIVLRPETVTEPSP